MSLIFDTLLVATLLWSAWRSLATSDLVHAVVMFIVFGLLMSLAWARLGAPDIALAEAAIGAGLTGALLLDALRVSNQTAQPGSLAKIPALQRMAVLLISTVLAIGLIIAVLYAPLPSIQLPSMVEANMAQSGVTHTVTAVLLNFRGYDTLLEVAVLLLALLGMLAVAPARPVSVSHVPIDPVLATLARLLVPLMILTACYLLWAGDHRPGGAFQAAAVLAAAGVLLHLAGLLQAWIRPGQLLRLGLSAGFVLFLSLAAILLTEGALLRYPPVWAGALILLIEAGLTLSLSLILAGLFLLLSGRRGVP
ncbi:MAG: DUF4040 domain-containing protein [Methylotenera sp.]|nr:DUF4040 domain-containing protein [Methylotenera sp.]MDO9234300.1 DUF4040 domain-containing protein [Methylotenera sp.]MDO9388916.1 DUF4040 domain-containing protein [Methylotenera sp.]MDP2101187.1 DUF4040 domain-containing protein [Methylotenera sp.]MDP2280969.1 DUF4040 domain-containing protein [Methylotenera sp.]